MKYDCNKTLDFSHEYGRMCHCYPDCEGCPMSKPCPEMSDIIVEHIAIVQRWSDEHPEPPKLTKREYEFLKTFIISMDKAVVRGKLMKDLYIHDTRYDTHYAIDPMMFSFIREEEQMTFNELLKLEVEE